MKTLLAITSVLLALSALTVTAATRTWDGSASGLLSTPANWVGGGAPVNGDDLVFPDSGVSRFLVTNNIIGGPRFPTITFLGNGFTLSGAFIVTSRIGAENLAGVNRINCALQLSTNATFFINGDTGALLDINGDVALGAYSLSVSAGGGSLFLSGVISGTGGISKISGGTVRFDGTGANTYTGPTTVFGGTLELFKGPANTLAVPGDLTVNGASDVVRLLRNNQLASTSDVTLGPGALLDLQSFSTPIGTLTLNGGQVTGGTLTLNGNVTATSQVGSIATISGNLSIGLGPRTFTVNDNTNTNPDLDISALISGVGGIIKAGTGTLAFSGSASNTFMGATRVFEGMLRLRRTSFDGSIPGNLFIGDGVGPPLSDAVRVEAFPQINDQSAVIIASSGYLEVNGATLEAIGSLAGEGQVNLVPPTPSAFAWIRVGHDGASTTYSGQIIGRGHLTKLGLGTLTLTADNTYSGSTLVVDGRLLVNGAQPQSTVSMAGDAALGGTGTVGDINPAATLNPGLSPGILQCNDLTFPDFPPGDFFAELNGALAGNGYDQLVAYGAVTLNDPSLHISVGSPLFDGQSFTIILNHGSSLVNGQFAGLPNGSTFTADGRQFRVTYNGGSGNDVVLVVTNVPLKVVFPAIVSGGNLDARIDPNECSLLHVVLTNRDAVPVTGIRAMLRPQTDGVSVTQPFATYPDLAPNAQGTNLTPFQISLMPGFLCGYSLFFELIIETTSHGTFRAFVGDTTGIPGASVRFDNNTPTAIPDAGTSNSTINVSGIATPIQRAAVSFHITHPSVDDLDVWLIDPLGRTIILSSNNGGNATNYGTSCLDEQRTMLTGLSGIQAISAAAAPFVGTFRASALGSFEGRFGPDVNGSWKLRIDDEVGGDAGTLQCWSLFITPYYCAESGGPCESCPERTILGFVGDHSQLQTGRLIRDGNASACGAAKSCPGVEDVAVQRRFDAYTFENGESNACVTVTLVVTESLGCELFSATYTNAFNSANVCANYLADLGDNVGSSDTNSYSFNVAAYARFVVVVSQSDAASASCRYRLDVTGGSCHPVLHIANGGSSRAVLDWTTAAVGYELDLTPALPLPSTPQWTPVTNAPVITNSRFHVTNSVGPDNTRFFRLRKP